MPSVCVMPTPPTFQSKSSPRPRLRPSHHSSIDPFRLHRIPTGRIGRARSASALSLSDSNRQAIYEAAIESQTALRAPFPDCTSDDGCPLSDIAEVDFTGDRIRACSVPTSSLLDHFPSSVSDIDPITAPFTDLLPQISAFSDCGSMEVMMPSNYSNVSSYTAQYDSVYGDSHTSGEHSSTIAAQASPPALSYAASYASTPPAIAGSPALSHASMSTPGQPLTRPSYRLPSQSSYSQQYPGYTYDPNATAAAQGQAIGYASPYAGSSHYNQASAYYHHQQQQQQQQSQADYAAAQSSMYSSYYGAGASHPGYASSHTDPTGMSSASSDKKPQCFEHGCNGRAFSTFSNLLRHQREKSGTAAKSTCPECGAKFTRTTARNGHVVQGKCKRKSSASVSEAESF